MPKTQNSPVVDLTKQSLFEVVEGPDGDVSFALPGETKDTDLAKVSCPVLDNSCLLLSCVHEKSTVLDSAINYYDQSRRSNLFLPDTLANHSQLVEKVADTIERGGNAAICIDACSATEETLSALIALRPYHEKVPVLLLKGEHTSDWFLEERRIASGKRKTTGQPVPTIHSELIKFHHLIEERVFDPTGSIDVFKSEHTGLVLLSIINRAILGQIPQSKTKSSDVDKSPFSIRGTTLFLSCLHLKDNHLAERTLRYNWGTRPHNAEIIQPLMEKSLQNGIIDFVLNHGGKVALVVEPEHIDPTQLEALRELVNQDYNNQIVIFRCQNSDPQTVISPDLETLLSRFQQPDPFKFPSPDNNAHFRGTGQELMKFGSKLQLQAATER